MMFFNYPAASRRRSLPSGLCLLGIGWWWIACAALAAGQEPQRQERLPVPGEVVVSISIRVSNDQPRFVVAGRVVEEALGDAGQKEDAGDSPPEIVDYFKRNAQEQIADIDRVCGLTEPQQAKLELAAMGDMSRVVRKSREVREKHAGKVLRNQHQHLATFEDVALLNRHLGEGVLRDGSMFLMILKSLLSPAQMSQLAEAKFAALTTAWPIDLPDDQRQRLWRLALRNNGSEAPPLLWSSKHCRALVAKISQEELVSSLGEANANTLRRWCER